METTTIKVSAATRDRIKALGAAERKSADAIVQAALDAQERALFWDRFEAAATAHGTEELEADAEAWAPTLKDGLDD